MQFVPSMSLLREQPVARARQVTLRCGVPSDLPPLAYWRERIKLHGRAMLYPEQTARWLALLNSQVLMNELVGSCPRLLYKIYRPYLTARFDMDQRIAALSWHYNFLLQCGLEQLSAQAARGGVRLASVEGRSGLRYELMLGAGQFLEREGELVLSLCQDGTLVYSAAFTFCAGGIDIGCIEGSNRGDGLDVVRTATGELYGVRPKQLLVSLLGHLGHALGGTRLFLVGNANRVVGSAIRQGEVCADYDRLWREMGAHRHADGDFTLACMALADAPELDEIPLDRRAEVGRRHATVTVLAEAMAARFLL